MEKRGRRPDRPMKKKARTRAAVEGGNFSKSRRIEGEEGCPKSKRRALVTLRFQGNEGGGWCDVTWRRDNKRETLEDGIQPVNGQGRGFQKGKLKSVT